MTEPEPIRAAVGRNVRRLRDDLGMTADELARSARVAGLNWTTARVSQLEHGKKAVSLAELLVLAAVLTQQGRAVRLPDLFHDARDVEVTDSFHITGDGLRAALSGGPVVIRPAGDDRSPARAVADAARALEEAVERYAPGVDFRDVEAAARGSGSAEDKAARALGVPAVEVLAAAVGLWGRSLTQQRDDLAGPDASAQRRGNITRGLVSDLGDFIEARRGDD